MFHYNAPLLQQQQIQFTTHSQQNKITQQSSNQKSSQNQQRNKLSNIASPTFNIYGVQDPTFIVADNSAIHQHEQIYTQQQLHSLSDPSNQREHAHISQAPTQHIIQPFQIDSSNPETQSNFNNSNQLIGYLDANTNWNNQQFLHIQRSLQSNLTMENEKDSISSTSSSPNISTNEKKVKYPMNAFIIFSTKRRKELSSQNPSLTTSEISTILSDEWTAMSIDEKNKYILQAQMIKNEFERELPDSVYNSPNISRKKKRSSEDIVSENYPSLPNYPLNPSFMYPYPYGSYQYPPAPTIPYNYQPIQIKQSPNAFILFSADARPKVKEENPDSSVGEISRLVGIAWKNLPEEEKNKYYEESKRLRQENNELKKFAKAQQKSLQNKMTPSLYSPYNHAIRSSSPSFNYAYPPTGMSPCPINPPQKRLRTPKDPTQPKHPCSAFIFYLRDVRPKFVSKNPKKSLGDISKMISAAWKELTAEEKAKYEQKSNEDKKRYVLEMEMWIENNKKQKNKEDKKANS